MATPALFPLYFIVAWFGITFVLSRLGWARLARKFGYADTFDGESLGIVTGRINEKTYRKILSLQYNEEGIYMRPVLFFRLFHHPVLIPWKYVKIAALKFPFMRKPYELCIPGNVSVSVFLSVSEAEKLKRYADPEKV